LDTTIIYYSDNRLNADIFKLCLRCLKAMEKDFPVVSVTHEPVDLGKNICVGKQKRSWLTLYRQLKTGLESAGTKYVAMAEHDCLYTTEHMGWTPLSDDTFFYNENVYLVQWTTKSHPELNGMYSRYWRKRLALSQLVCNRELLLESTEAKLKVLDDRSVRAVQHAGEPGATKISEARRWAKSGRPVYLKKYLQDQLEKEKCATFETELPNLDIRHDENFTGPKRGRKRTYEIRPWGRFENLIYDSQSL